MGIAHALLTSQRQFARRRISSLTVMVLSATLTAFGLTATTPAPVQAAVGVTSAFHPVTPCRLADTREPASGAADLGGNTIRVQVSGRCDVPPGAIAITATIVVDRTAADGYATAWPAGRPRPFVSNLNWHAGDIRANSAMVALGESGAVDLFTSSPAAVIVDVTGAFVPTEASSAGRFVSVTPQRAIDTRETASPLAPGQTVTLAIQHLVPPDATAVAVNITSAGGGLPGFFTAWAGGTGRPTASTLNTDAADQVRGASAIVPVSAAGVSLFTSGGGHVVVDVTGYFTGPSAPVSADGLLVPVEPTRLYDSREDPNGVLTGRTTQRVVVAANAAAMVGNWTMVDSTASGFVSLRAAGTTPVPTAAVNAVAGQTVANLAITELSVGGVDAYTMAGTHLVSDLQGFFTGRPRDPVVLPFHGIARSDGRFAGPRDGSRYTVLYLGDSMAYETKADLQASLPGWRFHEQTFGGTAPCDWIERSRDMATLVRPDFVVVSFLGNNITACTDGLSGGSLVEQYRRDITTICRQVAPAACVLVGQAPLTSAAHLAMPGGEPTELYRSMVAEHPWWFVDAGSAVEDEHGGFVASFRSGDLVHFSPPGARRYAGAIADFLRAITAGH